MPVFYTWEVFYNDGKGGTLREVDLGLNMWYNIYIYIYTHPLIAMENGPFIDGLPRFTY